MIALVTGGAASGKSAFAESLALSLPGPHAYVATMRHGDAETEARIARHRQMREGKGFATFELAGALGAEGGRPLAQAGLATGTVENRSAGHLQAGPLLPQARLLACNTALLEDLGNLVANGLEGRLDEALSFPNVVVVANEVGCDGRQYDPSTMDYIRKLGGLACQLGARADVVVEVVAGIPNVVKGEVPTRC